MGEDFAHVENETDEEFYGKELRRAGLMLRQMRQERDQATHMAALIVEAAGGSVVVPRTLLIDGDGIELTRIERPYTSSFEFVTSRPDSQEKRAE